MGFMKVRIANAMALAAMLTNTTQYLQTSGVLPLRWKTCTDISKFIFVWGHVPPQHMLPSTEDIWITTTTAEDCQSDRRAAGMHVHWTLAVTDFDGLHACRDNSHDLAAIGDLMILSGGLWLWVAAIGVVKVWHSDRHDG